MCGEGISFIHAWRSCTIVVKPENVAIGAIDVAYYTCMLLSNISFTFLTIFGVRRT